MATDLTWPALGPQALAAEPAGSLLLVSTWRGPHGRNIGLRRIDPDTGSVLMRIQTDVSQGSSDYPYGLSLQPDGRIVVVGRSFLGPAGSRLLVARYEPDGSLDERFGDGGLIVSARRLNGWQATTAADDDGPCSSPPRKQAP